MAIVGVGEAMFHPATNGLRKLLAIHNDDAGTETIVGRAIGLGGAGAIERSPLSTEQREHVDDVLLPRRGR